MGVEFAIGRVAADIASRQHGVVARRQLLQAGVGRRAIGRGLDAGRLHLLHRGVYAVGHRALSRHGRWLAAVLACGGGPTDRGPILTCWGAALSHRSAAELWGLLPLSPGPVDVSVAGDGGRGRRADIAVHRSRTLTIADVTLRDGVPVTTSVRTVDDLRDATRRGRMPAQDLRRAIREAGVAGLAVGSSIRVDRTRGELESHFLLLCRRWGLPRPEVNVRLGPYLVDFLWRRESLVVETDSYKYHRGEAALEEERRRDLALREMGFAMVRITGSQLADEPERVRATLVRELARPAQLG